MKKLMLAALLIVGCGKSMQRVPAGYECDKTVQERVFLTCLEKLPNGPERLTAAGNDWDEVVAECRVTAAGIACVQHYRDELRGWWE